MLEPFMLDALCASFGMAEDAEDAECDVVDRFVLMLLEAALTNDDCWRELVRCNVLPFRLAASVTCEEGRRLLLAAAAAAEEEEPMNDAPSGLCSLKYADSAFAEKAGTTDDNCGAAKQA